MIVCAGCNAVFSYPGYPRHISQTTNPPCVAIREHLQRTSLQDLESATKHVAGEDDPAAAQGQYESSHVDLPLARASDDDLEINPDLPGSPRPSDEPEAGAEEQNDVSAEEQDDEEELEDADNAEMEFSWEPPRAIPAHQDDDTGGHQEELEPDDNHHSDEPPDSPDVNEPRPELEATAAGQLPQQVLGEAQHALTIISFPCGRAGQQLHHQSTAFASYQSSLARGLSFNDNIYTPFVSRMDYQIARWAKMRGPGSTAFNELLQIDGVCDALRLSYKNTRELNRLVDSLPAKRPAFVRNEIVVAGESFDLFNRDILKCIQALYGDPEFSQHLVFAPERHYVDEARTKRMYYEMHTGRWWWDMQKQLEEESPGATIIPVVLSSDKTQVTMFRNKSCYPLYLTIGNLPKEIRRKPSRRGWILLAYLPVTRLEHIDNKAARRRATLNLFHACLRHILEPLEDAGRSGVPFASGNGVVRRNHPLVACYPGDYPEQVTVTGVKTGDCPKCDIPGDERGSADAPAQFRDLAAVLEALALFDEDYVACAQACKAAGIKPVHRPFWERLPYINIFQSITPDVLHQLYQGLFKHLLAWIKASFSEAEIDARCRRLPPNHNIRLFMKGVTSLSRLSGTEHSQICAFLLGIIIDIPLPHGFNAARLLRATRALIDFIFLAQYPCHTSETLQLLDDALRRFHDNKDIFVSLGIRTNFNLPKLHSLRHYVDMIQQFGTTDNYSTEYTERLHIDLAKDAYRATNHKDEYYQMTNWLERREKMQWHDSFLEWQQQGQRAVGQHERIPPDLSFARSIVMTKHPSAKAISFNNLMANYRATYFIDALCRFVARLKHPELSTPHQLERAARNIVLPFFSVPIFHRIKFHAVNALGEESPDKTVDAVHCQPERQDKRGKVIPGRFDTVLVNLGDGGNVGVHGYQVAQVRVIFTLSDKAQSSLFPPEVVVPSHLAYVEWFTPFTIPDTNHGLYKVTRSMRNGERLCSIISVANIRRSVHLLPRFGKVAPVHWTSSNVLEECRSFFVNPFSDRHAYLTIV